MSTQGESMTEQIESEVAEDLLERYSGSHPSQFQPYILLTNFPHYVTHFGELTGTKPVEGSMMKACHWPEEGISILDFKVGSPAAALAIDILSFTRPRGCLMLGMCGGLRRKYKVGDFLLPVAAIRGEGTSEFYFPSQVPALSNFVIQKCTADVMDRQGKEFHIGICHSTNIRFWEFDPRFRQLLIDERVQGIEMECATLFTAGYKRRVPVGALLLISDLPLERGGIKTKKSSKSVSQKYTDPHVRLGIDVMKALKGAKHQGWNAGSKSLD